MQNTNDDFQKPTISKRYKIAGLIILGFVGFLILKSIFSTKNPRQNMERWANYDSGTAKTLNLDVTEVQQAFKKAKNPEEFEKKVNEIYTGKEIISLNVQNKGNQNQIVTLYIDKEPKNGKMDEPERVLSLNRNVDKNKNEASVQTTGYGAYQGYSSGSPFIYGLTSGLTHYWIMSSLMYNTPMQRSTTLQEYRKDYRKSSEYKTRETQKATRAKRWASKSGSANSWKRGAKGSRSFSNSRRSSGFSLFRK